MKRRTMLKQLGIAGLGTAAIAGTGSASDDREVTRVVFNGPHGQQIFEGDEAASIDSDHCCVYEGEPCCTSPCVCECFCCKTVCP